MKYYGTHKATVTAAVFVVAVAMVAFAFFLSALRRALTVLEARDGQYLSIVTIVGGAVYIGGMLVGAVFQLSW